MILDSELCNVEYTDDLEAMLRIQLRSGWFRRLWTLNEGIYSQEHLFAVFKNAIVRVPGMSDKLIVQIDRPNYPLFKRPIVWDACAFWTWKWRSVAYALPARRFERTFFFDTPLALDSRIAAIWENVSQRMTSTESDRPILVMSLLGLDLSPVLNIPPNPDDPMVVAMARMKAVYKSLPEFPENIIFLDGKRFPEYGMRWALGFWNISVNGGQFRRLSGSGGRIIERGLCVNFASLLIPGIRDEWKTNETLLMKCLINESITCVIRTEVLEALTGLEIERLDVRSTIGFLIQKDERRDIEKRRAWSEQEAVVVHLIHEEIEINYARYLGRVKLRAAPEVCSTFSICNEAQYIGKNEITWCVG